MENYQSTTERRQQLQTSN